jgi:hypothetical protein
MNAGRANKTTLSGRRRRRKIEKAEEFERTIKARGVPGLRKIFGLAGTGVV